MCYCEGLSAGCHCIVFLFPGLAPLVAGQAEHFYITGGLPCRDEGGSVARVPPGAVSSVSSTWISCHMDCGVVTSLWAHVPLNAPVGQPVPFSLVASTSCPPVGLGPEASWQARGWPPPHPCVNTEGAAGAPFLLASRSGAWVLLR